MDWFLYDIGLRHERVKKFSFCCALFKRVLAWKRDIFKR